MKASDLSLNEPFLFVSQLLLFLRITVQFTMVAAAVAVAVADAVVVFPTTSHVL